MGIIEGLSMKQVTPNTKLTITIYSMIALMVIIIGFGFKLGSWVSKIESSVELIGSKQDRHFDETHAKIQSDMEDLEVRDDAHDDRFASQDVKLTEIQTDLKWIRATMESNN